MIPGVGLPCPQCKRELAPESWIDARDGVCLRCETEFQFVPFPALTATRTQATAQAAVLAADSVCFFHAENRAEAICEGCGRLLCPVCAVPFDGRKLCPACIATGKSAGEATVVRERVLYDSIALALALTGSFIGLAMLSVVARLVTYVGTAAAIPVLRKRMAGRPGALELAGGPTIPLLALALSLAFLASAEWGNLLAGGVALGVGAVIYVLRRRVAR